MKRRVKRQTKQNFSIDRFCAIFLLQNVCYESILEEYLFDVFNFYAMKPIVDVLESCKNGVGLFTLVVRDKFILKLFFEFSTIFLHPSSIKDIGLVNYFGQ